jgi:hypothetical protein
VPVFTRATCPHSHHVLGGDAASIYCRLCGWRPTQLEEDWPDAPVEKLFDPCGRYRKDAALISLDEPSCADCAEQYEDAVCVDFQRRLFRAAGLKWRRE